MAPIVASGTDWFDKRYSVDPVFAIPTLGGDRKNTPCTKLPNYNDLIVPPMPQINQAVQRDNLMKQNPCAEMLGLMAMRPPKIKSKGMGIVAPSGAFRHQPPGIMTHETHNTYYAIQKAPDVFHHELDSRIPMPN